MLIDTVSIQARTVVRQEPPESFALVDRFYRAQGYKVKCAANERVFTLSLPPEHSLGGASCTMEIIAAARLVPQRSGSYWLRNLLVKDSARGQGLAVRLMRKLLNDCNPYGCYCFALPHLKDFYLNLNFTLDPAHSPRDITDKFNTYRLSGRDWLLMGHEKCHDKQQ